MPNEKKLVTLEQMLLEMNRINCSELFWAAKMPVMHVFLYPINEDGEWIDINGHNPWCDISSYEDAKEVLTRYCSGNTELVDAILKAPYTRKEDDAFVCNYIDTNTGKEKSFAWNFWHY